MKKMNSKVDTYIKAAPQWKAEMSLLRKIILETGLEEDFKWRLPCYSQNGKNIAIIQDFKNSCALMFFKGSLLKDPKKLLIQPGENSQAQRRLEFKNTKEITTLKPVIKAFIKAALEVEDSGAKVGTKTQTIPTEFKKKLSENKKLKAAFESLTPGRQRHYLMHFSSAKQTATRESRIEKCIPQILKGRGLTE